jgi:hypothetical protein
MERPFADLDGLGLFVNGPNFAAEGQGALKRVLGGGFFLCRSFIVCRDEGQRAAGSQSRQGDDEDDFLHNFVFPVRLSPNSWWDLIVSGQNSIPLQA